MEDGLFTPPPGQVRASNVPSHKQLSKVTALIKKEMSFVVRPKKHAGLETILDATKVDVGHIAYDLLRYFTRASVLISIVGLDGIESLKNSIRTQCRDFELNVEFFDWLMVAKIGTKPISEYLWRGLATAVDLGMKKVINALVQPSTANIGRFLPTDVIQLHRSARDKAVFDSAKKLFKDCLNLPVGLLLEDDINFEAFERGLQYVETAGCFRTFYNAIMEAQE